MTESEVSVMDFIITSNGPGEISTWVKPVVREIKKAIPSCRISVFLLPCQYASGHELELIKKMDEVDRAFTTSQYWQMALQGRLPEGEKFHPRGVVLFLGGDQFHPVMISSRLGYPVYGYTEGAVRWPQFYKKYFLKDEYNYRKNVRKGIPADKMALVGDLMVDALYQDLEGMGLTSPEKISAYYEGQFLRQKESGRFLVSLLPGSRDWQAKYLVPLFLRAAQELKAVKPSLEFQLILSPLLDYNAFKAWIQDEGLVKTFDGVFSEVIEGDGSPYLQTSSGLKVALVRENKSEYLLKSTLALTIPGTNTAELGILGIPFVLVFPLTKPEVIPLEGLLSVVDKIPWLGRRLKEKLVGYLAQKERYFSWPNKKAQRFIVPELAGDVSWKGIREMILQALEGRDLALMSKEMVQVMGEPGAARRLVSQLQADMGIQ